MDALAPTALCFPQAQPCLRIQGTLRGDGTAPHLEHGESGQGPGVLPSLLGGWRLLVSGRWVLGRKSLIFHCLKLTKDEMDCL